MVVREVCNRSPSLVSGRVVPKQGSICIKDRGVFWKELTLRGESVSCSHLVGDHRLGR